MSLSSRAGYATRQGIALALTIAAPHPHAPPFAANLALVPPSKNGPLRFSRLREGNYERANCWVRSIHLGVKPNARFRRRSGRRSSAARRSTCLTGVQRRHTRLALIWQSQHLPAKTIELVSASSEDSPPRRQKKKTSFELGFELCSLMYFERRMLLLTLLKQSTKH